MAQRRHILDRHPPVADISVGLILSLLKDEASKPLDLPIMGTLICIRTR